MSSVKFVETSPDNVYERPLVVPRDTDLEVIITAREHDEDCDPATKPPAYDFTGHTPVLEIFTHKFETVPILTVPDIDFTITQDDEGASEGVNNVLKTLLDWTDLAAAAVPVGVDLWYRVYILDAAGVPYTPQRGCFLLERF